MCWVNALEGEELGVSGSDTKEEIEPAQLEGGNAVVGEAAPDGQPDPDAPVRIVILPKKVSALKPHSRSLFSTCR